MVVHKISTVCTEPYLRVFRHPVLEDIQCSHYSCWCAAHWTLGRRWSKNI